jgi:hypothetical protein
MRFAVVFALALAGCAAAPPKVSPVTGRTYCGGIMDADLGDRLAKAKDDAQRYYAVIDFRAYRPSGSGNVMADIASCSDSLCFAYATKSQLFEYCDWVGVREISTWEP